jgi:glycosyltransferase involved in cell wall biosynthesis
MSKIDFQTYFRKFLFQERQLDSSLSDEVNLIVVIPCYNEPDLISTLRSLNNCDRPSCEVEVIVVVNQGEQETDSILNQNLESLKVIESFKSESWYHLYALKSLQLPKKHAGVGLARKIGMDEAVLRYAELNKNGTIACLDADSLVQENYLVEIEQCFQEERFGCNIYFEHNLESENELINKAIVDYELFLRYYNLAQNYINVPYAHFTVGSSMAVSCEGYIKVGGMNKRKAGEDFYFLQKIIQLGNFKELTSTKVYPSSRISDRVPFGTGKAVQQYLNENPEDYLSYSWSIFEILKPLIDELRCSEIEQWPQEIDEYFGDNFKESASRILINSNGQEKYWHGLFQLFNGFQMLKAVHLLRDKSFPNSSLNEQVKELIKSLDNSIETKALMNKDLLKLLRVIDLTRKYRSKFLY